MLASVLSANEVTSAVKHTITTRLSLRKLWSLMRGRNPLRMFSLKLTEGARRVALAQLLIAERRAPKNMICANTGTIGDRIRFGRISCVSFSRFAATILGPMRLTGYRRKGGMKAKKKEQTPPRIEEHAAGFS